MRNTIVVEVFPGFWPSNSERSVSNLSPDRLSALRPVPVLEILRTRSKPSLRATRSPEVMGNNKIFKVVLSYPIKGFVCDKKDLKFYSKFLSEPKWRG